MYTKNSLLNDHFGAPEIFYPEHKNDGSQGGKICSEVNADREIGSEITVAVAKTDIRLVMYGHSGSYVTVGSEVRGLEPELIEANFKAGEIIRHGHWVNMREFFPHIEIQSRKIKTKVVRYEHEYYEVE